MEDQLHTRQHPNIVPVKWQYLHEWFLLEMPPYNANFYQHNRHWQYNVYKYFTDLTPPRFNNIMTRLRVWVRKAMSGKLLRKAISIAESSFAPGGEGYNNVVTNWNYRLRSGGRDRTRVTRRYRPY